MTASQAAETIHVQILYDEEHGHWVASTVDAPRMSVSNVQYQRARRHLRTLLRHAHRRPLQIEEVRVLPADLDRRVRVFQRRNALSRMLRTYVFETRMPLARELLGLQLANADVAEILGISPAQLGNMLSAQLTAQLTAEHGVADAAE